MKNVIAIFHLFVCLNFVSCKKTDTVAKTGASLTSDTLILDNNAVIFVSPSDKEIERLKKMQGDDFYTIADDANNYFSIASSYLDSLKVSYKNEDTDKIIGYKKDGKFFRIPAEKSSWYAVLYKNGNFKTVNFVDFQDQYKLFFDTSNQKTKQNDPAKIIDSISGKGYSVVEKKECDLNNDSFKDLIVVFANQKEINPQDPKTKIAPIVVLINQNNTSYKVFSNSNIYPNSFADAFKNLVVKSSFFTIELTNEIPDHYTSDKYITFKYDATKNNIFLSKYGENINWKDTKTTSKICTSKDFGEISFESYNSDNIRNFCK